MEIVFRSAFIFLFLWIVTRAVGRSTLGELSTFQLLLYVTMGDLVQQAVTQQDYSVTAAVLAVGTFALLTVGFSFLNWRSRRLRPVIHGSPLIVIRDGEPCEDSLREERLTLNDLMAAAREQGIRQFREIELAVLEADGKISFFNKQQSAESGAPERPEAA
ncbi:MAG: DUF421 domain-containing protein [Actinomycetes bacterium]